MTDIPVADPAGPEPSVLPALPAAAAAIQSIVQSWLVSTINNSPVSRHTDAYNHLVASIPALVAALSKEI